MYFFKFAQSENADMSLGYIRETHAGGGGMSIRIFHRFHQPHHFVLTRGVPNVVLVGGTVSFFDAMLIECRSVY